MANLRALAVSAAAAVALTSWAQSPATPGTADHSAHHPPGSAASQGAPNERMAMMDSHMKAMREMHERMSRAGTPQERQTLMAEHMKLMQEGMALMRGMGPGGMGAMGPAGASSAASAAMDMSTRHQMMEKRMEMMQSMMQMMMDRMGPPPARP